MYDDNAYFLLLLLLHGWLRSVGGNPGRLAARHRRQPAGASLQRLQRCWPACSTAYWEEQARLFPLLATAQGDNRYNDRLPNDQTRAFRQQQARFYRRYLTDLLNIDRARLSADDKLSYDIFQYEMRTRLEGLRLNTWMMPFAQFYSLPTTLGQLGAGTGAQPFKTVQDYDNWLARRGPVSGVGRLGHWQLPRRA